MPEEEAALLDDNKPDIQSDIKPDIEVPHVPGAAGDISEQAQPAEWTITPTASPPSPPSPPSHLTFPKGKEPPEAGQLEQMP